MNRNGELFEVAADTLKATFRRMKAEGFDETGDALTLMSMQLTILLDNQIKNSDLDTVRQIMDRVKSVVIEVLSEKGYS